MAASVADPSAQPSVPPSPDECEHPAPVVGIMAREFGHYRGAIGPEGLRRTVTHYGPVIGGLPLQAWHCTTCGLLRISYPDGRHEERRLHPGPQPGLLAHPVPFDPAQEFFGSQARVSGLSVSHQIAGELAAQARLHEPQPLPPLFGSWGVVNGVSVIGLALVMVGMLGAGILAIYSYQTPASMSSVIYWTLGIFAGVILLQLFAWMYRNAFEPHVHVGVRTGDLAVVTFLSVTVIGLLTSGVLAVYSWETPGAEEPVVIVTAVSAVLALLTLVGTGISRAIAAGETSDGPAHTA